ncbi:MAG: hypothetical protein QM756_24810 [Polyangiaceae bacterium]
MRAFLFSLTLGGTALLSHAALAADPSTSDCLTAHEASLKADTEHKLRSERKELLICAARSCPNDIRKECLRRVDEVNASMPTLVFEVKDAAGNDLSAVRVTVDGEVLAERLDGTALSIDPGEHTFAFESAGQPSVNKRLMIRESEKDRRETVQLVAAAEPAPANASLAPAASPVTAPPAPAPAPASPASEPSSSFPGQRVAAIVSAGVGVVGIGVGSVFGLTAMSRKKDAEKVCPDVCEDDAGVKAWKDARSAGNLATVGFIVGGVGLAAAAVLWFTAPQTSGQAQVGFGLDGVRVRGTW